MAISDVEIQLGMHSIKENSDNTLHQSKPNFERECI